MSSTDRREFLKLEGGGVNALATSSALFGQKTALPNIRSTFNGVVVGCNTYSFAQSSLDEAIQNIANIGFGEAELHPRHLEPSFGARLRRPGLRLTPDEEKEAAVA